MIAPALLASTAIILLSFISEDAATISSALSIFGGPLSWPLGFAACFTGIWLGDLGLYSLARCAGKNVFANTLPGRLAGSAPNQPLGKTFGQNRRLTFIASWFISGHTLHAFSRRCLVSVAA